MAKRKKIKKEDPFAPPDTTIKIVCSVTVNGSLISAIGSDTLYVIQKMIIFCIGIFCVGCRNTTDIKDPLLDVRHVIFSVD
jgi:hypothetical protein